MSDSRTAAILRKWMLVVVGKTMHLVGVVEGHTRLPDGHWIITSPVRDFDPAAGVATTKSSGRRFDLRDRWQAEPPREAKDIVATAIETWRVSPDAVIDWHIADVPGDLERLGVSGSLE